MTTTIRPEAFELGELLRSAWPALSAVASSEGPTCLEANAVLREKLTAVEERIAQLRTERAAAVKKLDAAKEKYATAKDAGANSDEFKAAKAALAERDAINDKLEATQEEQLGILKMLGEDSGVQARRSGASDQPDAVKVLTGTPGALLAHMLESRKEGVQTLPHELRSKPAAMGPMAMAAGVDIRTTHISTTTETEAIIDLLSPQSVAMASGIGVYRIDTTKTRIPRFTDLPVAEWIPELGAFPKSAPGIEMVDVEPPKVGLVSPLSIEVFEDLTPLAVSMIQVQLLRAIALAYDKGILFGSGENDEPLGVANTPGIGSASAALTDLSAFAEAIAELFASDARPMALAMNPLDIGTLLQLVEFTGASESNIPLWKDAITGPSGLSLPYFKVPIWPTKACPQGSALMYDPATVIAVLRRDADIAIDPYYGFDTGEVGLRVYLRGDVVVGQAAGAVLIDFTP